MGNSNDNGKMGKGPQTSGPEQIPIRPEDILHMVSVVMTKDEQTYLVGSIDNLPLCLHLLSQGIDIVGGMVSEALPKRIILASPAPPPGTVPFGRAGG